MSRRPGVGFNRRSGFRGIGSGGGGASGPTYSPSEFAAMMPPGCCWISQQGVTQAGTVSAWLSYLGSVSATLVQAVGASQPAYNASGGVGGRPLITFDGTDDVMKAVIVKGSGWTSFEMGIVGRRLTFASGADFWTLMEATATAALLFGIRDVDASNWRVTSNVDLNASSNPNTPAIYSADAITGNYNTRKNGVLETTSAGAFTSRADAETFAVGGRSGVAAYANIAIQAVYCFPQLTAGQRTYLTGALTFYCL